MNNQKKPVANAFIDSQNLNLGVQKMGWKLSWRKFLEYLQTDCGVTKAYLFIGYVADNVAMYEQLHEMGYLIVLKRTLEVKAPPPEPNIKVAADAPKTIIKGNIDVELALWAVKEMPNYDKAIIVSGDGDFYALVEYLASKKKLHSLMVPNWQYSSLLKDFEPNVVRIDKMRRHLAYRGGSRPKPDAGKPDNN